MGLRKLRRKWQDQRNRAIKNYHKQKQKNLLASSGNHESIIVLDHLKPNYNIGKIFRSGDAFGVYEIHLIGIDFFNPAPAMGSFKWVPAIFHKEFDSCYNELTDRGYDLFVAEPDKGENLFNINFSKKSAFIFGHEEFGISFNKDDYINIKSLTIPQFGKVQSLNVSVAASIVLYEYTKQNYENK